MDYKYTPDGPVYSLGDTPVDGILDQEIELTGRDIDEIVKEDITDKIELAPEWAKQIEEAGKDGIVHALGACFDSALLLDIDKQMAMKIMGKAIEILKERKLY